MTPPFSLPCVDYGRRPGTGHRNFPTKRDRERFTSNDQSASVANDHKLVQVRSSPVIEAQRRASSFVALCESTSPKSDIASLKSEVALRRGRGSIDRFADGANPRMALTAVQWTKTDSATLVKIQRRPQRPSTDCQSTQQEFRIRPSCTTGQLLGLLKEGGVNTRNGQTTPDHFPSSPSSAFVDVPHASSGDGVGASETTPAPVPFPKLLLPTKLKADRHKFKSNTPQALEIKQLEEGKKIFDYYYWDETLQEEGHGGKVVACHRKEDGNLSPLHYLEDKESSLVMKIKSKKELQEAGTQEEFRKAQRRLLNMTPHCGVVPLHEVLEDDNFFYVVMEKASQGSLFSCLLKDFSDGKLPEAVLRQLIKEVLEAVSHIHKEGVLHRDIKPDNLVVQIDPSSPGGRVKKVQLIDFDVADPDWEPSSPGKKLDYVGTLRHSAPETLKGIFCESSDLYSIGTILYMLVVGSLPYEDDPYTGPFVTDARLISRYERMRDAQVDWSSAAWESIPECKNLCRRLLAFRVEDRPVSALEALQSPWFAKRLPSRQPQQWCCVSAC